VFQKTDYCGFFFLIISAALVGCHKPLEDSVAQQVKTETPAEDNESAKSLTEVAGKATVPVEKTQPVLKNTIPQNAKAYIGRYQCTISCKDPFANCDQGTSDYVINLLADGSAHRTMIHLGQITFASNFHYRQDRWAYDAEHHQVVVYRSNGVKFFYDIDQDKNLVMDLEKIAHASERNQQYFNAGNPLPQQAYRLLKEKVS